MSEVPEAPNGADSSQNEPSSDPWKSFRGVMAATLILEAVVVLLAIPVVGAVGGGLNAVSLGYLIGLTVLLVAAGGAARPARGDLGQPGRTGDPAGRLCNLSRPWDSSVCCSPVCGP